MRPIDADMLRRVFASGVRVYDGMCRIDDVMHNIDNAPTIDADAYFDAVDRVKACPNCRYTHIHKMLSENGNAPWISVEERLPKEWERVLVFRDGGIAIAERLDNDYSGNPMWSYTGLGGDPSYWMPLPMGPEEV